MVNAIERVKSSEGKSIRIQQLSGKIVAIVINQFSRACRLNPQVLIVDPFMGAGGTLVAAKLTGCPFIGGDKDKLCTNSTKDLWGILEADGGEAYENGAGLRNDLVKAGDGDEVEEGSLRGAFVEG